MIPLAPAPHLFVPPAMTVFKQAPIKMDYVENPLSADMQAAQTNIRLNDNNLPVQNGLPQLHTNAPTVTQIGRINAGQRIPVNIAPRAWSARLEKEFQALAESEITGTATDMECVKLKELQTLRRQLKNPRPVDEVFFEIRREVMLAELIQMFDKYVRFINLGPRPAFSVVELHNVVSA